MQLLPLLLRQTNKKDKIMKKGLISLCLAMTLYAPSASIAQSQNQPATTLMQEDTTEQDEVVAYSDTTSVDTTAVQLTTSNHQYHIDIDEDDIEEFFTNVLNHPSTHGNIIKGFTILGILLVVFLLAPLIALGLLLFFVYKNRRQKIRLAEEAMRNGQPIPDQFFNEDKALPRNSNDLRAKGIRQTCLGVGLMIFLGNTAGSVGFGVGALVTAIGVGNLLIARRNINNQ